MKVLIVGGVAGGAGAATRLRRLSEDAEIIMFEKGPYISYANCGLPYYIGGTIEEEESLIVTAPELLINRFRVDVRTDSEVLSIDPKAKTVKVRNHKEGREYEESYDRVILSPGAEPKRPPLPGIDSEGIFSLRTVPDTLKIYNYIDEQKPKKAVVVGAGFIGIEMAENLKDRGLDVTVIEFAPQAIAPLDPEMAAMVHNHLREKGVKLMFGTGVDSFEACGAGSDSRLTVKTNTGRSVPADLVLLSIGVSPESKLAKEAGLELGMGGSIKVDEYYKTSDDNIYAVGDAIQVKNYITGNDALVPLAGPANKQGRAVAENVLGVPTKKATGVLGSSVLKAFDLTVAATGLNEKACKAGGVDYEKIYAHPNSHAGYYPGATPISMKLLFSPKDGKILGAQAVGYEGVEKRIDVLATSIKFGGTVYDLEELELCYAPPFSSAKDPVNMLGFMGSNIMRGHAKVFHCDQIKELDLGNISFIDIRSKEENDMGTVPGAESIVLETLRDNLDKLPKDKPVYVMCQVGLRGYIAQRILMQHGYDVYNLSGGYKLYCEIMRDRRAMECEAEGGEDCGNAGCDDDECSCGCGGSGSEKSTGVTTSCCCNAATSKPSEKEVSPGKMTEVDEKKTSEKKKRDVKTIVVDACGLQCPGPIMKVSAAVKELEDGDILKVHATDPAFAGDIGAWCERTCNTLVNTSSCKGVYSITLKKGTDTCTLGADAPNGGTGGQCGNDKTMVVFSGDLDKALASFIIANGAAAMGRKVTMFFTFWGLNVLRKNQHVSVKKTFIERMFGMMMPRGSKKLGLSRMQMMGVGPKMIRSVMGSKNVQSLEELMELAMDNGVKVIACQMSMDVMGIKREELLDGVEIGGVATYLGAAETADTNLFI